MSEEKKTISKGYILVAPDGGWGYVICLAMTINLVTTTGFIQCFGMIYKDFLEEISMDSTHVTLLGGINSMFVAISGFVASPLLKILSIRKLAFISALIYDVGVLGTVFTNSKVPFFICFGVLQGTGFGLSYNISVTRLNEYFLKRRLLANSIAQTAIGFCTMLTPTISSWSLNTYGFRGTLLLITGISLQNFIASALMQPCKWHMKKNEIDGNDEKQMMLIEDKSNTLSDTPIIKSIDLERKGSVEKGYEFPADTEKRKGWRKFLETFIDLSLCKTFVISCACIGPALIYFADGTGSVLLPQALYAAEWEQESVSWALSSILFGDLAIRVTMMFSSKWLEIIGNRAIILAGIWIGFISRLGMLWSTNHIVVDIYIGLMGVSRGLFVVVLPVVIADAVAPEQFTSAIGIVLLISGIMCLTVAPAIGKIRDSTNSYPTALYILACIYAIVILFWSIEILYKRNEHKRRAREESLKKANKLKMSNKAK